MQGDLADLPLIGVLELIHFSRKSGVLDVNAPVPFTLSFSGGEVVAGGVLDWEGLDAIYTLPPTPERGRFAFSPESASDGADVQLPLKPFARLVGDWAHLADEWRRVRGVIGSPSRVLRPPTSSDQTGPYAHGRSVRAVARASGEPLFDVAKQAAEAAAAGRLELSDRYAWHALRLRHPRSHGPEQAPGGSLERLLDGQLNLGELIDEGHPAEQLRAFLLRELRAGLRFPGAGWVLRDLAWEEEAREVVA